MLVCTHTASLLISITCGSIALYGNCETMHGIGMTAARVLDLVNRTKRMSMVDLTAVFVIL